MPPEDGELGDLLGHIGNFDVAFVILMLFIEDEARGCSVC